MIVEDDFDPIPDVLVDSFDLSGALFLNPDDFQCGEAFIITIDQYDLIGSPEVIELVF